MTGQPIDPADDPTKWREFVRSHHRAGIDRVVNEPTDATTADHHLVEAAIQRTVGLRQLLEEWRSVENANEGYWQSQFADNAQLISQAFAMPLLIFNDGNAYLGGKGIENRGARLADFIFKNGLSQNLTILEIKTPSTPLLGTQYRTNVYAPSSKLSGAVVQVLGYRDSLTKDFKSLVYESSSAFEVFSPQGMIIAGTFEHEIADNRVKQRSFELFRSSLGGVQILTYDELFKKLELALDLFLP